MTDPYIQQLRAEHTRNLDAVVSAQQARRAARLSDTGYPEACAAYKTALANAAASRATLEVLQ